MVSTILTEEHTPTSCHMRDTCSPIGISLPCEGSHDEGNAERFAVGHEADAIGISLIQTGLIQQGIGLIRVVHIQRDDLGQGSQAQVNGINDAGPVHGQTQRLAYAQVLHRFRPYRIRFTGQVDEHLAQRCMLCLQPGLVPVAFILLVEGEYFGR